MKCKTFYGWGRQALEDQINAWLETHPVSPESIVIKYALGSFKDESRGHHFVLLFYVPMMPIG